jgi:hypothetical protein
LEFPLGEFWGIVNAEKGYFFAGEIFSDRAKFVETICRFIPRGKKGKRNVARITTNEQNEIFEPAITRRKRTANVTMDALDASNSPV